MSLLSVRMKTIQSKMKSLEWSQHFSHYKYIGIGPNFELIRDFIVTLVTCKNEKGSIKTEGPRVETTLYVDFYTYKGR